MQLTKYTYSYSDKKGYYLKPENYEIENMLPSSKETGLVKICRKKDKLYLFFNQNEKKYDSSNREIDFKKVIYEISDYTLIEVIKQFDIKNNISNIEKRYFFELLNKYMKGNRNFEYENPYFALIMLDYLDNDICFEKSSKIFDDINLNKLEKCIFNNFKEEWLKSYILYKLQNQLKYPLIECIEEEELPNFLDDCKKDIFENAKKLGVLEEIKQEIFTRDCMELKKNLLQHFIDNANEKQINFLYKAMKSKFFILGF
jgi:hypothetical protein